MSNAKPYDHYAMVTHGGHRMCDEFYEAMAERDPAKLRAELLQVSAVAAAWVESIDRRAAEASR